MIETNVDSAAEGFARKILLNRKVELKCALTRAVTI
jgi:hypothetical protein